MLYYVLVTFDFLCLADTDNFGDNIDFQVDGQTVSMSGPSLEYAFSEEGALCFDITVFDDALLEFNENFTFSVNETGVEPFGVVLDPAQDTSMVTILDDEGMTIVFGE